MPKGCDIGVKSTGKGYLERWTGYKLHLDAMIPISCLLTSASVHDSQAAIPLAYADRQAGHQPLRLDGQRL